MDFYEQMWSTKAEVSQNFLPEEIRLKIFAHQMAGAALGHCVFYLMAICKEASGSCSQSIKGTGLSAALVGHSTVASAGVQPVRLTCLVGP